MNSNQTIPHSNLSCSPVFVLKQGQQQGYVKRLFFILLAVLALVMLFMLLYSKQKNHQLNQTVNQSHLEQVHALLTLSKAELKRQQQLPALIAALRSGLLFQQAMIPEQNAPHQQLYTDLAQQVPNILADTLYNTWERNRFVGHMDKVRRIAFSPSSGRLISGSSDNSLKVWQIDGQLLHDITHPSSVYDVAYSSDGSYFVSVSSDYYLRMWRNNGQLLAEFAGDSKANGVDIAPDSQRLAAGFESGQVMLWLRNGHLSKQWQAHEQSIERLAFSPDGQMLATASADHSIGLWHSETGELIKRFRGHQGQVQALSFHPNKPMLISGSRDQQMIFWDLDNFTQQGPAIKIHDAWVFDLSFSPDGQQIASVGADGYSKLWDSSGRLIRRFKTSDKAVFTVAFSPDGKWLATAGSDKQIHFYSLQMHHFQQILTDHQEAIQDLDYNAVGDLLASTSTDGQIQIWDQQQQNRFHIQSDLGIRDLDFLPGGNGSNDLLMSATTDNRIQLWRLDGNLVKQLIPANPLKTQAIAIDPQGEFFISSHHTDLQLWSMAGESLRYLKGHETSINAISFSHNGQWFASGGADNKVFIWARDGHLLHQLSGHSSWINNLSFSPDDNYLASASADNTLKLWKVREGQLLNTLEGHSDWVWDVDFHPDINTMILVSASADSSLRLWRYPEGRMLRVLSEHQGWVRSVSFNHEGDKIASAGTDKNIILWDFNALLSDIESSPPLSLNPLVANTCHILHHYLQNNPDHAYEQRLCQ